MMKAKIFFLSSALMIKQQRVRHYFPEWGGKVGKGERGEEGSEDGRERVL